MRHQDLPDATCVCRFTLLPRNMGLEVGDFQSFPPASLRIRVPLPGDALDLSQRHIRNLVGLGPRTFQGRRGVRRIRISVELPRRNATTAGEGTCDGHT